jgi:hypothetical protein
LSTEGQPERQLFDEISLGIRGSSNDSGSGDLNFVVEFKFLLERKQGIQSNCC